MRTQLITRAARLAAATGFTLAISSATIATAAMANASGAQVTPSPSTSPTTTPTPDPSPTTKPPVVKPPGTPKPVTKSLDASVTARTTIIPENPKMAIVRFTVRSDKPTASYRLVLEGNGLEGWAGPPNHANWDCTGNADRFDCRWTGKATTDPAFVSLAYGLPKTSGYKARGTVSTTEADTNPANNTVEAKIILPGGAPTPAPQPGVGTIAGRVWHDVNINGREDKGEKGVAGARVIVSVAEGTTSKKVAWVTTRADGRYSVKVPAGVSRYGVAVAAPSASWNLTDPGVGAERGDSDFRRVDGGAPFDGWFGKNAIVGIHDRTDVFKGRTTVLDAGLIRGDDEVSNGSGTDTDDDSLPVTGAGAAGLIGAGALLLGGGVALTVLARRRRTSAV